MYGCFPLCLSEHHMFTVPTEVRAVGVEFLGLGLQIIVSGCVGAENETQVL